MSATKSTKVVVVTGCSSGIGFELVSQLCAEAGVYHVIGTARTLGNEAVAQLEAKGCDMHVLDVTDEQSVKSLSAYVREKYGRCDVLVNNAGYGVPGSIEAISVDEGRAVFEVNVWGVMRMIQNFLPLLRKTSGGMIVTVSSLSGVIAQPFADIYAASKFAVEGMLESLRYSVASDNIKVCVVNPGATESKFGSRFIEEAEPLGSTVNKAQKLAQLWANEINRRNCSGHPADQCAKYIVEVIKRDADADLKNGLTPFRNHTSEFAKDVMSQVLIDPSATSKIYSERLEVAQQFEGMCEVVKKA